MQQIVVVDLTEDTIRKFSCIQAIHVAPGYLSAKVINLDAKCKYFRVYFFVERKFIFWGVRIYFLRARIRLMEGRILAIHEAIHETINETINETIHEH